MNKFLDTLPLSKRQLTIFGGTFSAMFFMVMLQTLGIYAPHLVVPLSETKDVMDIVKPKLDTYENTFTLKKHTTFVSQSYASGNYDFATAYAVIDLDTAQVVADKAMTDRFPIASLTKIMTAVVALDLSKPTALFKVSKAAAEIEPTRMGVAQGQQLRLEELMQGLLLTSANDAAQVIRENIDGSYNSPVFVKAMNAKAEFIGLKNTHFANPQGFDSSDNYSSAEDLAILTHYALSHYPLIASTVQKEYAYLPANKYHTQFDLYNWNGLVGVYPDVKGVKIGNTDWAKKTTVVFSNRGGKRLVAVILGAPGILERDEWAAALLDLGYERTLGLAPVNVTPEALQAKYNTWKYWN